MQVGEAELCVAAVDDAGEGHRPPLRGALVDRQLTPLDDPAVADQGEIRAALAGSDQVGVDAGGEGAQGAERVARGQHPVRLGSTGFRQRLGEARRALLQQRHVPLGRGKQMAELPLQIAIDLDVGRVALRHSQQA